MIASSRLRAAVVAAAVMFALVPAAASASPVFASSSAPGEDPNLDQKLGELAIVHGERVLEAGHLDMGPKYDADGAWRFLIHDDVAKADANATSVWRYPDETVLHVRDEATLVVPDDAAYAFLGADPGTEVWVAPQTQDPDVVWIGWNTQDPAVMETVDRGVTLSLRAVEGPGVMTTYLQSGSFGAPQVLWDSRVAEPQPVWVDVNTHTHANWVFTAPGVYLVELTAEADLIDGSHVSDTQRLRFAVGTGTAPADAFAAVWAGAADDAASSEPTSAPEASATTENPPASPLVPILVAAIVLVAGGIVAAVIVIAVRSARAKRAVLAERAADAVDDGPARVTVVAALEVSGLAVDLGGRRVLEGVDLAVERGELVALLGPNGAGKTTLLRAVLGLQPTAAGHVRVEGRPSRPGRAAIGYVPQRHEFAWDFPISVADVVMTGLSGRLGLVRRPGRAEWEAVADALRRVRLSDLAARPVGQLSGGQRQRVLVARALALSPAVLLLDEPFTGLDMPTQELLSGLFADLAHEGRAVLMTTHDLLGAVDGADRLALLNRTIITTGTPAQLTRNAEVWAATFGVGPDSTLVRMMRSVA